MTKATWITICSTALVVSLSAAYVPAVHGANLLGATVNGDVHFKNYPSNYYDPLNGFAPVPPGYLNTLPGSNIVTIQDPAIEFGFGDNSNLDTADFTDTQLIITDVVGNGSNNWIQTFISPVFTSISKVSDNFDHGGVNATIVGNTITLAWPGTDYGVNKTFQAVFNINVPEPSTLTLLGLGVFSFLAFSKRLSRS